MQRINFQPISKIERTDGQSLLIHSIFFTIQGEGPNVGKPAVFVRLGGCNLQCPGCDTNYTDGAAHERIDSVLTRIRMAFGDYTGERLVVITGGEPFRQSLEAFLNLLFEEEFRVQIESNGTAGFGNLTTLSKKVWHELQIVVSPKAGKITPNIKDFITAYKYVLDANNIDPDDGLPECVLGLPGRPARPHADFIGEVYVQPADEPKGYIYPECRGSGDSPNELNDENLQATVASAMKYGYRLCIQTHKIAGLD